MLKIEMEQYDNIMEVSHEIGVLLYLQNLFLENYSEDGYIEQTLGPLVKDTEYYLLEKEQQALLKLRELLKTLEIVPNI